MVLREVRETGGGQVNAIKAALLKAVGRSLHCGMGHTVLGRLGQTAVQGDRLGRGVGQRRCPRTFNPGGAEVYGGVAKRGPDLPDEGGNRCFAVRSRYGHDGLRLRAEPQRRGTGQRLTRVFRHGQRCVRGCQFGLGDLCPFGIGQDRSGPHAQGKLDELCAMNAGPGQRGKEEALFHLAAVNGQTSDIRVCALSCGQGQLAEFLRPCAHDPPLAGQPSLRSAL